MHGALLPTADPLVGRWIRLDPLGEADVDELARLLEDPEVYAHGFVMVRRPTSPGDARALARSVFLAEHGRADGRGRGCTAYAVRLVPGGGLGPAGALAGSSALWGADLEHETIHLGRTLYGPRWWGTQVNPEAKLLLLAHCFEDCGYGRVTIQTDAANARSQAAITKLGAVREGVLRRHRRREDGSFRDTVVYSVVREEWPAVKARLLARLGP